MATLVGNDNIGDVDTATTSGYLYNARHVYPGTALVAGNSGDIATLHAYISSAAGSTFFRIAIYDTSLNLLDYTLPIAAATGEISGDAQVGYTISASTSYIIAITVADLGSTATIGCFANVGSNTAFYTSDTYASAPVDPLSSGNWFQSNIDMMLWAEDSGASSIIPQAAYYSNIILG